MPISVVILSYFLVHLPKYKRWQASFDKVLISSHMWYFLYHVVLKFSFCMEKSPVKLSLIIYLHLICYSLNRWLWHFFFFFACSCFRFFFFFKLCSHSSKSGGYVCFLGNLKKKVKWSSRGQQKDFLQLNSITGNDWNESKTAFLEWEWMLSSGFWQYRTCTAFSKWAKIWCLVFPFPFAVVSE